MDFLKYLDKFFETLGLSKASLFVRGLALIASGTLGLAAFIKIFDLEAYFQILMLGGLSLIFALVATLIIWI